MYRFPTTRFIANPPFHQLEHVKSEIAELEKAYLNEPVENVAMEALDAIHSLETFLRGWEMRTGVNVSVLHDLVVEKNRNRGYYVPEDKIETL
jgi:hypothetical protein